MKNPNSCDCVTQTDIFAHVCIHWTRLTVVQFLIVKIVWTLCVWSFSLVLHLHPGPHCYKLMYTLAKPSERKATHALLNVMNCSRRKIMLCFCRAVSRQRCGYYHIVFTLLQLAIILYVITISITNWLLQCLTGSVLLTVVSSSNAIQHL